MEGVSPSPSASQSTAADVGVVSRWSPHGQLLTACLVVPNVFLALLVYVYFWCFFSRARSGSSEDDASSEATSSPPGSPKARDRREVERAITALPVFVHSSVGAGAASGAEAPADCAICIAEFADGEEGRLLPRCGHRFHARCIDTWFRFHTTCPLCRTTVLLVADEDTDHQASDTDANADADCPV